MSNVMYRETTMAKYKNLDFSEILSYNFPHRELDMSRKAVYPVIGDVVARLLYKIK
jgi:hypothetical protein